MCSKPFCSWKPVGEFSSNLDARVQMLPRENRPVVTESSPRWECPPYDGNTSFRLYLRELGAIRLLSLQEEKDLAARIKRGDAEAREQMILANLKLVVKIAREYEDYGLPLLDLISEGNIGLMQAVERFDPTKGAKFSTYGAYWIKQSIRRALAYQSKTIRLPAHVVGKLARIRRSTLLLLQDLGRDPSDEELGVEVGLSATKVASLRAAAAHPTSLQSPLEMSDDLMVIETIKDDEAVSPLEELEEKSELSMLRVLLAKLSPRVAKILRYRFGLDAEDEQTLDEVGLKFGLTRERVRQLQEMALLELRREIEEIDRPIAEVRDHS